MQHLYAALHSYFIFLVNKPPRPRSLMILPAPKLISLEEAQARSKSGIVSPVRTDATSPTGVRMREWTGKSSERRYLGVVHSAVEITQMHQILFFLCFLESGVRKRALP